MNDRSLVMAANWLRSKRLENSTAVPARTFHDFLLAGGLDVLNTIVACEKRGWIKKSQRRWMPDGSAPSVRYEVDLLKLPYQASYEILASVDAVASMSSITRDRSEDLLLQKLDDIAAAIKSDEHGGETSTPVSLTPAQQDVINTLQRVGKRMTKQALNNEIGGSIGTLGQTLAVMVQFHLLNNRKDTYGKGYGLPNWI